MYIQSIVNRRAYRYGYRKHSLLGNKAYNCIMMPLLSIITFRLLAIMILLMIQLFSFIYYYAHPSSEFSVIFLF